MIYWLNGGVNNDTGDMNLSPVTSRYFKMKNCDVAISATRTRWGSAEALNEFAERGGVKVDWIPKSYEYNLCEATRALCNKETAEFLFTKI